ncbi:hypothetical protein B0T21DRAFT_349838 [Apiosordaria backusii]|uniref:Uncharacterized protein n=1 Tax=Apiosordaria backusii TaxID=314023 RepID=A0AA40BEN7_9PEZI|nr:hypothetical protein B0T21DRAFT_349838 [Apiosordaria backusii]
MHFRQTLTALTGLVSSVVGAPIGHNTTSRGGLNNTAEGDKISLLGSLIPPLGKDNIILPGAGLNVLAGSAISQLARITELELAALVESQFAFAIQLETIKTNIRINHFKAQFPQVNCVILCVTNVLDQRDPDNINNRYLLNQLRINNGFPDKELLIMVTDSQEMTIVPTPTAAPNFPNNSIPNLSSSSDINTDTATSTDTLSSTTETSTASESTLFPQPQPTSTPLDLGSLIQPTPSPSPPSPNNKPPAVWEQQGGCYSAAVRAQDWVGFKGRSCCLGAWRRRWLRTQLAGLNLVTSVAGDETTTTNDLATATESLSTAEMDNATLMDIMITEDSVVETEGATATKELRATERGTASARARATRERRRY